MEKYSSEVSKLVSEGSKYYSHKDYELACDKYGEACQQYSESVGEEDADLLFLYGKALFHNAVSKSEVFGGDAEKEKDEDAEKEGAEGDDGHFQFYDAAPVEGQEDEQDDEGDVQDAPEHEEAEAGAGEEEDENEAGKDQADASENETQQSDFETAWEILDLTRALWEEKIELFNADDFQKPYDDFDKDSEFVVLVKKLSETYDLLGEVSLEAENFPQAAIDLQKCLDLRQDIYGSKSSLISESHYKLSLALEFCVEDPKLREKAAESTRLAIESIKARNADEKDDSVKKENNELIKDLQARYSELKKDPNEDIKIEQLSVLKGILGEATNPGSSSVNQLQGKRKSAVNDLTSSVKKRKNTPKDAGAAKKP